MLTVQDHGNTSAASIPLALSVGKQNGQLKTGDVVVTSGVDGIYPKGLVVGRVSSVEEGAALFQDIRVQPSARFNHLEEVLVVLRENLDTMTPESVR